LTDEQIAALTPAERRELILRLIPCGPGLPSLKTLNRIRKWRTALILLASLALIPWTVYLAVTLPNHYVARNWVATWVGFDILLLVSFAAIGVAALAGRRRGQALWAATIVTATLLCCDAWFDITTATRASLSSSVFTAVAGNLPLAALLLFLGYRSLRHTPAG